MAAATETIVLLASLGAAVGLGVTQPEAYREGLVPTQLRARLRPGPPAPPPPVTTPDPTFRVDGLFTGWSVDPWVDPDVYATPAAPEAEPAGGALGDWGLDPWWQGDGPVVHPKIGQADDSDTDAP